MRGSDTASNVVRFFLLLFLQVFLFRQVSLSWGGKEYLYLFIAPLFIALLPLRMPRPLIVVLSFLMGICVDIFYDSPGIHAAAATFAGYIRQYLLAVLEPKDGYKVKASPDGRDLSNGWWFRYLFWLLLAYCLFYFSMQAFAPQFWQDIFLKTLVTVPVSWILCYTLVAFLRPRI